MAVLHAMRYEGPYTPPSTQPVLQVPGNRGGANWGSTAGDPRNGTFFVLSYNMPSVLHLVPIVVGGAGTGASPFDRGQDVYIENCLICHGANLGGQPAAGIPSLNGVTDRLSHDEFAGVIRDGRGVMPGFPRLGPDAIEQLQMFLSNPDLALTRLETVVSGEIPDDRPVRYQSAWRHILDRQGVPVIEPPWFRLTAYDLNGGTIKWQTPAGEVEHLARQGIKNTGSAIFVRGGPAITAGGLVFLSTDNVFRAYDIDTGEELWSSPLPGSGEGIPAVYAVNGRQYVGRRGDGRPALGATTPCRNTATTDVPRFCTPRRRITRSHPSTCLPASIPPRIAPCMMCSLSLPAVCCGPPSGRRPHNKVLHRTSSRTSSSTAPRWTAGNRWVRRAGVWKKAPSPVTEPAG